MKDSIDFLNSAKRRYLHFIVESIRYHLPETEMIILYGSYARDEYVQFDSRVEFGVSTYYCSDYDILVVTNGISYDKAGSILSDVEREYLERTEYFKPPLQIIHDDINDLNQFLSDGKYFYDQISREGIMLYNSGKFELAKKRNLLPHEMKEQAKNYYAHHFDWGNSFLDWVEHYKENENHYSILAPYYLHQACESFYYAIQLVFTLKKDKQHDLSKLESEIKEYSPELSKFFIRKSPKEKHLFKLLKAGYIEGRYNSRFKLTSEEVDALLVKMKQLRDITIQVCEKRIEEYKD